MKNLIGEKPSDKLSGRLKKTFEFVDNKDIKGKIILDIGCGYGWFEYHSLKKGAKKIIGVEISEEDLSTIKKYITAKNFEAKIGHASNIPVKNSSVDTVVSWEVIEHIPKKSENDFFSEVSRILKKNGTFYLSTPHHHLFSTYLDPAFWLVGHRHYSKNDLIEYGERSGFVVEKIVVLGGIWTALSIINMYISKWVFRRPHFGKNFFAIRVNNEYTKQGFYNVFVKYRKR